MFREQYGRIYVRLDYRVARLNSDRSAFQIQSCQSFINTIHNILEFIQKYNGFGAIDSIKLFSLIYFLTIGNPDIME